jgi:hypothetical protein
MRLFRTLAVGVALSCWLVAGCTSKVTEKEQYSGFISNYDGLQETTLPSGQTVLRWVAPGFKPSAYSVVVFRQLELYPAPKPTERVSMQTLQSLQSFASSSVKTALAQKYRVVTTLKEAPAGSRAMILRSAITGVTASNEGMHWYEVVPVAAVVGGVTAASGSRDQDTELYVEAELVDATTGAPLVKAVRKVFGKTLENSRQAVSADDFKAAIKIVTDDMKAFFK